MNQRIANRLNRDLPRLLKAYREGQHFVLTDCWLARTELMAANALAEAPNGVNGQHVGSLLRWAISLTPQSGSDSAALLQGYYVQRLTVEAVAERLSISMAAFHKVRQPKAIAALGHVLAPLLAGEPSRQPALLEFLIEDQYANLTPAEQKLIRFIALFRQPASLGWVRQTGILGQELGQEEMVHGVAKLVAAQLLCPPQPINPHNADAGLLAHAAVQTYWRSRLPNGEAQAWHRLAYDYAVKLGHYIEAAHHQLELNAPELAAQVLIAQQDTLLNSSDLGALLAIVQRIQPGSVRQETWAALKLMGGQAAQKVGDALLAVEAYRAALSAATQPRLKAEVCYRYANALEAQDIDGALIHYRRSIELFQQDAPADLLHVRAHIDLVWIWLQTRSDMDKAVRALRDADALFVKHHPRDFVLKADLHNAWARWFHLKGERVLGIEHRQQALLAANESGNQDRIMKLAHNLGQDHRDAGQYALALRYLEESLVLARKTGNQLLEGVNYETIGGCYFFLHDYQAAIHRYHQARALFVSSGNLDQQGWAGFDLCEAYLQIGDQHHANQFYNEAMQIAHQLGQTRLAAALAELSLSKQALSRPEVKRLQRRAQLFVHIQQHNEISNRAYRALVAISQKQAARDLTAWVQEGTLCVVGQGRSVTYRLADAASCAG